MRRIVSLTLAASVLVALGVNASPCAAAVPIPPAVQQAVVAPIWTGWYVGGNLGYGWNNASAGIGSTTPTLAALIGVGSIPSSLSADPQGWLTGVQLGYNYQIGRAVFGVETDIALTDIARNVSATNPGPILPFASYRTTVE